MYSIISDIFVVNITFGFSVAIYSSTSSPGPFPGQVWKPLNEAVKMLQEAWNILSTKMAFSDVISIDC